MITKSKISGLPLSATQCAPASSRTVKVISAYRARPWRKTAAAWEIATAGKGKVTVGRIASHCRTARLAVKAGRDIDNIIKPVSDASWPQGLIKDDSLAGGGDCAEVGRQSGQVRYRRNRHPG